MTPLLAESSPVMLKVSLRVKSSKESVGGEEVVVVDAGGGADDGVAVGFPEGLVALPAFEALAGGEPVEAGGFEVGGESFELAGPAVHDGGVVGVGEVGGLVGGGCVAAAWLAVAGDELS